MEAAEAGGVLATSPLGLKKLTIFVMIITTANRPAPQPAMTFNLSQGISEGGGPRVGSVTFSGSRGPRGSAVISSGAGADVVLGTWMTRPQSLQWACWPAIATGARKARPQPQAT